MKSELEWFAKDEVAHLSLAQVLAEFDADWYTRIYQERDAEQWSRFPSAFAHYVRRGARDLGFSPNAKFDEGRYLETHADVRDSVLQGIFFCGFHHYVTHGRAENRLAPLGAASELAALYPQIEVPVALAAVDDLRDKLRLIPFVMTQRDRPRINFLVPTLHPALLFGGYRCLLELIDVMSRDVECRILLTNAPAGPAQRARPGDAPGLERCEIVNVTREHAPIPLSKRDRLVCYSAWTMLLAHQLAVATDLRGRPLWLVQEHEAIFHEHDAYRALVDHAYALPHVAIFNTEILASHFRQQRLGVFAGEDAQLHRDFGVVHHAITDVARPTVGELAARPGRRLLVYGRPEAHARRNLLEIVLLGLERAVSRGVFDGRWTFTGFGTLGSIYEVDLGGGRKLTLHPRLDPADYARALKDFDLGVSLMYAPHPSIVPFEMAGAGLVTITNTFENRDRATLCGLSSNLEPCTPDPEGVAVALAKAIPRVEDFAARVRGAEVSWNRDWSQAFDPLTLAFIRRVLTT